MTVTAAEIAIERKNSGEAELIGYPDLPPLVRVSRRSMAAPSAGSGKVHEVEQREIIEKAFS